MALVVPFAGCAHSGPAVATRPPVPMTFFPADNEDYPDVVQALNVRLQATFPPGPTVSYAKVTLEEAQVAVGCSDATVECWNLVAEPIPTQSMLVAEVKKEGSAGVRLNLMIYDAAGGKTLRHAERVFLNAALAKDGVPEVVDLLVAHGGGVE